ncbi:MAG: pyridoxal phosphate-dependent aminotransferase [Candidatus Hydrogenedentota bacterium]|nr:MAG: pyridoxal phosphate-dependent aminotransferase [Candidatus Hydrogenedentota bacterium]
MALRIAKRVGAVGASPTLAITAKAKALKAAGKDVIGFGAGEPDFDTPEPVKEAAIEALRAGFTKYTPAGGIPELKEEIVKKLSRENDLEYSADEVVVTTGAKHALYVATMALVDDGDEVIIPAPYWVTYPEQARLAGGVPVIVRTREEDGFRLRVEDVEAVLTERSRMLVLNSPANPTGAVLERGDLEALAELACRKDLIVLSDEIYEPMIYDGRKHISIATFPGMRERTIVVNGASKGFSMTGWRIGWAAGPKEVIKAMSAQLSHSTSNATSFSQKGAVAAYRLPKDVVAGMVAEFEKRRREIVRLLNEIPGVSCLMPGGAFYVFPNVAGTYGEHRGRRIDSSLALTEYLLEEVNVAVVHGEAFGTPGYVRLSYATSMEKIQEGVKRISEALAG